MNNNRFYLDCPYEEKDMCKRIGAIWDVEKKKWYVPEGDEPNRFKRWLPKSQDRKQPILRIVE